MPESTRDAPPPAPPVERPVWRRRAVVVLLVAAIALGTLGFLVDDDRFFQTAAHLFTTFFALLGTLVPQPRPEPDDGPSPWTPAVLLAVAVLSGLAGGALLLGRALGTPASAMPLLAVALLPLPIIMAVLVGVTIRAVRRGESIRGRVLPGLSASDRRRARRSGTALGWTLWLVLLAVPWLPHTPLIWGPVSLAVALGTPLWVWWVTRLAAGRSW
jgi:hypothetical protein